MAMNRLTRAASMAALVGVAIGASVSKATAIDQHAVPRASAARVAGVHAGSQFIPLGIGKSVVVDLPGDVKDVLVADPKIANAVIRSTRRAYLIGVSVGQTSIYFFDAEGQQLAAFDIAVTRDLNGIRAAIRHMFPASDIRVEGLGDGVVLAGTASSPLEAQQVRDMAARLVGDANVVNNIVVKGRDQVMLKVTVAEVQRDVLKQLGIDINGTIGQGAAVLNFSTNNPFPISGQPNNSFTGRFNSVDMTLRAMERAGVIRTLAEPTLTAISGESATFVAGGEFPIPAGLACDTTKSPPVCQAQVEYKKFGVSLNFTPVVLSEGRISLKVLTEASDLSTENSISFSVPGAGAPVSIPSIRVRRAETTVEIPSGGALALAGMIQEQTKAQINGVPGLADIPILGALFRSRDYLNRQTELMILVTPYTVRAVAPKDLSRPDDGFADSSDPAAVLLGQLNRIYGVAGKIEPGRPYHGKYGFIID